VAIKLVLRAASHWMHRGFFFQKKFKKYPEGFLKCFSVFQGKIAKK
jgi:hypothetical protein